MDSIFILQLAGIVSTGGFIGEFNRAAKMGEFFSQLFWAKFLTSLFLSFLVSLMVYIWTDHKVVTIVFGGLMSYQDEEKIEVMVWQIIKTILRGGGGSNDTKN